MGISIRDMELLTDGMVYDMMTESSNDDHKYAKKATQEDMDRIFG